jgi:anti-sigma factor RsiW
LLIKRDPLLVAYVDGELDAATAQEVEALLAGDRRALQRVEMFRETAALLSAAFDDRFYVSKRPVPALRRS